MAKPVKKTEKKAEKKTTEAPAKAAKYRSISILTPDAEFLQELADKTEEGTVYSEVSKLVAAAKDGKYLMVISSEKALNTIKKVLGLAESENKEITSEDQFMEYIGEKLFKDVGEAEKD